MKILAFTLLVILIVTLVSGALIPSKPISYEVLVHKNKSHTVLCNGKIYVSDTGWRSEGLTRKQAFQWIEIHQEQYGGKYIGIVKVK